MHHDWCVVANAVMHLETMLLLFDIARSFEEAEVAGSGGEREPNLFRDISDICHLPAM